MMGLWDLKSGEEIRRFELEGIAESVAFSPDGRQAMAGISIPASVLPVSPICIWDLGTGRQVRRIEAHPYGVTCAVFSKDGRRILSCGYNKQVGLWDVESGSQLAVFQGHRNWIRSVAFSPNGRSDCRREADRVMPGRCCRAMISESGFGTWSSRWTMTWKATSDGKFDFPRAGGFQGLWILGNVGTRCWEEPFSRGGWWLLMRYLLLVDVCDGVLAGAHGLRADGGRPGHLSGSRTGPRSPVRTMVAADGTCVPGLLRGALADAPQAQSG